MGLTSQSLVEIFQIENIELLRTLRAIHKQI